MALKVYSILGMNMAAKLLRTHSFVWASVHLGTQYSNSSVTAIGCFFILGQGCLGQHWSDFQTVPTGWNFDSEPLSLENEKNY
jgi:hypothetical protein